MFFLHHKTLDQYWFSFSKNAFVNEDILVILVQPFLRTYFDDQKSFPAPKINTFSRK